MQCCSVQGEVFQFAVSSLAFRDLGLEVLLKDWFPHSRASFYDHNLVLIFFHSFEHRLLQLPLSLGHRLVRLFDHAGKPLHVDRAINSVVHTLEVFVVKFGKITSEVMPRLFINWSDFVIFVVNPVRVFMVDSDLAEVPFL